MLELKVEWLKWNSEKKRLDQAIKLIRINPKRTGLLIIDVQKGRLEKRAYPHIEQKVSKMKEVLKSCRDVGMPIFYAEHVYQPGNVDSGHIPDFEMRYPSHKGGLVIEGTEGGKTIDELKPQEGDYIVLKNRPSAFFGTRLKSFLQAEDVDTVLVMGGTCLAVCGMATIVDAIQHNYRAIGVTDCLVASDHDPDEVMHEQMVRAIAMNYGYLIGARELINSLGG